MIEELLVGVLETEGDKEEVDEAELLPMGAGGLGITEGRTAAQLFTEQTQLLQYVGTTAQSNN